MGRLIDFLTHRVEKLNPAQPNIAEPYGETVWTSNPIAWTYTQAYEKIEVVNRGINMIVDDASGIDIDIGDRLNIDNNQTGIRLKRLQHILNVKPNPFQDVGSFRRAIYADFLLDGNIFLYFDGAHLYHLPAANVEVLPDDKTFVKGYKYNGLIKYKTDEIIHIKDNSLTSLYRGDSRLKAAKRSINLLYKMQDFQDNFFTNGAVPGLVLKSPNTLSQKVKERLLSSWIAKYNPRTGGRRPLILDGGLEVESLNDINFKSLDFEHSVDQHEKRILKALGVPPILLDGGNNANIRPNHRLYYLETVLPVIQKVTKALEAYFGYDLEEITANITALRPELKDQADYYTKLVNSGILTRNEVRDTLRYAEHEADFADDLILPANIAGSAAGQGDNGISSEGKPSSNNDGDNE